MPKFSGDKLVLEMMENHSDIPIILFTGYIESINADIAQKTRIKEFSINPLGLRDLAETSLRAHILSYGFTLIA